MKKKTAYIGLAIFIIGLIVSSIGLTVYETPEYNSAKVFWSWFSFIGFILLIIGGIILLVHIVTEVKKMTAKNKFYIGLSLVIIGIVTNSLYYYFYFQGYYLTGIIGIFVRASASILPLFLYFVVGGYLVYKNRYWVYEK